MAILAYFLCFFVTDLSVHTIVSLRSHSPSKQVTSPPKEAPRIKELTKQLFLLKYAIEEVLITSAWAGGQSDLEIDTFSKLLTVDTPTAPFLVMKTPPGTHSTYSDISALSIDYSGF